MTKRIGTILGTAAFAAGLVGAAAAQDSEPKQHFERFTQHEINMCFIAQAIMSDKTEGEVKDRYLGNLLAFVSGADNADTQVAQDRADVLRGTLSEGQLAALADNCAASLLNANAPPRFALPQSELIGEAAYLAYRQARSAVSSPGDGASADRSSAQTETDRLHDNCRSIMDAGVAKATRNFKQAQSEIQVWIRAGAFGSAPGSYDIQNGCNAIDSAGSQLNANQCPAEYAQALMNFRAGYYIDFNGGSGYGCN